MNTNKFTETVGKPDERSKPQWEDRILIEFRDSNSALSFAAQIIQSIRYDSDKPVQINLHGKLN